MKKIVGYVLYNKTNPDLWKQKTLGTVKVLLVTLAFDVREYEDVAVGVSIDGSPSPRLVCQLRKWGTLLGLYQA